MVALERCGDNHEVCVANLGLCVGFQFALADHFLQHFLHPGFYDVQVAGVCHLDDLAVDVHPDDVHAVFGGYDGGWQADVA